VRNGQQLGGLNTMTTPKRPPGRPPMDENVRRSARVELRLTQAQRDKLDRLGGAHWVRTRIERAKDPATGVDPFNEFEPRLPQRKPGPSGRG
jgi:hypothetical protein